MAVMMGSINFSRILALLAPYPNTLTSTRPPCTRSQSHTHLRISEVIVANNNEAIEELHSKQSTVDRVWSRVIEIEPLLRLY